MSNVNENGTLIESGVNVDVNDGVNDGVNDDVNGDVKGTEIVKKLTSANADLLAFKNTIDTQIESLITLVNNSKALNTQQKNKIDEQLKSMQDKLQEKMERLKESKTKEATLNKQLVDIETQVNQLEKNIIDLLKANETQKGKIDAIQKDKIDANSAPNDVKSGGYQYKNPRSKRKLNKNNRFGVLKTKSKSKSKSKKGKKKRKLGKGKKSMRGGMKKRTKSKRKSKNSKKTRKRRKKNKRK